MKTIECVVNGVKVEAGQWWMTAGGKIMYVVGVNPFDCEWPIQAHDAEDPNVIPVYHRDGKCFTDRDESLHRHLKFCTGFDWVGEGYRLLNVETDVAALGDERWNNYDCKWEHRSVFDGAPFGKNVGDVYRRKIAVEVPAQPVAAKPVTPIKPTIDPGEGYRLLSENEPVMKGDEALFGSPMSGARWYDSNAWQDGIRAYGIPYRRKLPAKRTETEYYLLPNAVSIAYIVRGTDPDAKYQTVLKSGKRCVAFDELHTGWKKCTQQEACDNLARMNFKPRYFYNIAWRSTAYAVQNEYDGWAMMVLKSGDTGLETPVGSSWTEVTEQEALSRLDCNQHFDDDDLEEDDDDFTDLGDVDDEDYDDDDRVQEVSPVTINITVNVFPAFGGDEADSSDDDDCCENACGGCYTATALKPIKPGQFVTSADVTPMEPVNARQPGGVTGGTPSPNPGTGYRLIDKNIDSPKDGDQYWNSVWNRWEDRCCMTMRFTPTDIYRRKIEPAEPVCEAGYRWLVAGEVIKATDQFQNIYDKQWKNPCFTIGRSVGYGFKWRRPIKPAPAPVEYRTLQVGEVIEKGDEFKFCGGWEPTTRAGGTIMPDDKGDYRRKIDPTKDRYFVFTDGFSCYKVLHPDGRVTNVWSNGQRVNTSHLNLHKHINRTDGKGFTEVSKDFAEAAIVSRKSLV